MTVTEIRAELLDRLGKGDDVFAAETLKERAAALAEALAGVEESAEGTLEERARILLEQVDQQGFEFLAVLLPLVEYGRSQALDVLPRALRHVARRTSLSEVQSSLPLIAATLVIGRLVWAMTAYSLHCGRLDALTSAWRATVSSRYEDRLPAPLLADTGLRHPDVFGQDADKGYQDYREWLRTSDLIGCYPLFAAELDEIFAEADFLIALRTACASRWNVYSHGFSGATVIRLRGRLADGREREQLARFFSVGDGELDEMLAEGYSRLKVDPRGWERPPAQLFTEE
jgi:hypothetical protein